MEGGTVVANMKLKLVDIPIVKANNLLQCFKPSNCRDYEVISDTIKISCFPGQDEFNMPGLYIKSSLSKACIKLVGDFTFIIECDLLGREKFDGAGIYLLTNNNKLKFGIECYGINNYRIVSVRSNPYSDEANGNKLDIQIAELLVTRNKNIFSCYLILDSLIVFERAFSVPESNESVVLGVYAQSPFSKNGATARFGNFRLTFNSSEHIRE